MIKVTPPQGVTAPGRHKTRTIISIITFVLVHARIPPRAAAVPIHSYASTWRGNSRRRRVSTPLLVSQCLTHHPDRAFVRYILRGLTDGFRLGDTPLRSATRNIPSASQHPEIIDEYLQTEVTLNRMLGPFPPGRVPPHTHVNRMGLIPKGHNTGKWRRHRPLSFLHFGRRGGHNHRLSWPRPTLPRHTASCQCTRTTVPSRQFSGGATPTSTQCCLLDSDQPWQTHSPGTPTWNTTWTILSSWDLPEHPTVWNTCTGSKRNATC